MFHLIWKVLFYFYFTYMYVSAYMYVCALFSCLETTEARSRCTGIWKPPCVPVARKARIICWILWKWLWATMWVLGVLCKSSYCLNCLAISPVPRILRHFKESFQEKKMYQELAWWEAMDTGTPYLRVTYDSLGSTLYTRVLIDLSYESVQESCVLPKS